MIRFGRDDRDLVEAGFTLIELLVALVVIAITLGAVATGLRLLGRSGERGAKVIARHDMLSRGVDVLRRDIERIERVVHLRDRDAAFVFDGDEKHLTFVSIEPPLPSAAGPYFVVYSIEQDEHNNTLLRSRAPYDATADVRRLRGEDEVNVLQGPYILKFAYLQRDASGERWMSRWLDNHRLPALVRLEIRVRDRGPALPTLVFAPRIDAEQGCVKGATGLCTLRTGGVLVAQPATNYQPKN